MVVDMSAGASHCGAALSAAAVLKDEVLRLRMRRLIVCSRLTAGAECAPAGVLQCYAFTKASKSGFTTSAWVVHMPCGKFL